MEYLVIFIPLIGSIITYFGKSIGNLFSQIFSCSMIVISAGISFFIFYDGLINDNYGNYLTKNEVNQLFSRYTPDETELIQQLVNKFNCSHWVDSLSCSLHFQKRL